MAQASRWRAALARLLAALLALALAAACVVSDDSPDDAGTDRPAGEGDGGVAEAPEEGDTEPVKGGRLVYGVEADSANPWAPYRVSCAISCYVVLQTVTDSLVTYTADGELVPNLLESVEPNEDHTVWTMTLRDGITFHDGSQLDAAAVKFNIETCVGSPLAGASYANVGPMQADGQVLTIATARTPWIALPSYFTGQCGYMFSPDWLASLPDVPHRTEGNPFYDAALAATPPSGDPAAPVGLGPFVFRSYTPGNGNSFVATRNEEYWRGPNGVTGEDLPYLDEMEIVVAVDIEGRSNGLRSGQFDVIHTSNSDEIASFQGDDRFELVSSSRFAETNYIMLNVGQGTNLMTGSPIDPSGANAASPLTSRPCRRALAHAIDRERLAVERGADLVEAANGPFPPGSVGHLEDSGYPEFDEEVARNEMEACLAARGADAIEFAFNTTNDPFNVETNQLIISMWQEVFGDQVRPTVAPIEQGQYIGLALTGAFNALAWRNHGGVDPDEQRNWWISATASPIGSLGVNFGRISDPVIDESLQTIRVNPNQAKREQAAEEINRRFGSEVYNLWLSWALWGIVSDPVVNSVVRSRTPGGETGLPVISGRHPIPQMWCDAGNCGD